MISRPWLSPGWLAQDSEHFVLHDIIHDMPVYAISQLFELRQLVCRSALAARLDLPPGNSSRGDPANDECVLICAINSFTVATSVGQ
jgi:hypothetical protein